MAIGGAHLLGFKLKKNFDSPYLSASIAEFWHRWHISLSTWLRDYVYFPLGGNRVGKLKAHRNLLITMVLGGLWHGANWTFVVWGAYHGCLLSLHRVIREHSGSSLFFDRLLPGLAGRTVRVAATFLAVTVGWVIFRASTLTDSLHILQRMFIPTAGESLAPPVLALTAVWLVYHFSEKLMIHCFDRKVIPFSAPIAGLVLALGVVALELMQPGETSRFIYFQF